MFSFEQFEFVETESGTADPSPTLRFSRDDKFLAKFVEGEICTGPEG
jgi:hypothetical protein